MSTDMENHIEQDRRSHLDFFRRHLCFYLLLALFFWVLCNMCSTSRMDSVHYAAVGSHLYYNHNWLPIDGGGYSKYANEGYEFLHCLATFVMGNSPLCRGIAISFIAFMLGSVFYVKCLQYFFTLRESQLILLLQLPLLIEIILPLTDSVGWCFCTALMWIFMKKGFRASFVFGLALGAGYLCRNQVLVVFLPLPILMGTPPTWKKEWRALTRDLCRCAAGFAVSLLLFELFVFLWVDNQATSGNFYVGFREDQEANARSPVWLFLNYCLNFLRFRFDIYGAIAGVASLIVIFCPPGKFARRFAWFILFSFAATCLSYAVLVYSSDRTARHFPTRYFIYYFSSLVPMIYYFAAAVARRAVPFPNRTAASRARFALLAAAAFLLLCLPLYALVHSKGYFLLSKHSERGLSCVDLYRNELALSNELRRARSVKGDLFVVFGNTKIEWYKAINPLSSYDAASFADYRAASAEKRRAAVENFFNDHELRKYARIILTVDKTYLNGARDKTDKTVFEKFLSDERFSKAFDRKEYDCKDCVFFVFIKK